MFVRDEGDAKFVPCLEKENGRVMVARETLHKANKTWERKRERERREVAE